jgi:hypothetical protein
MLLTRPLASISRRNCRNREQRAAVLKAVERDAVELEILHTRAIRTEGGVRVAAVTGMPRRAVGRMTGLGREADEGRDRGISLAIELGNDRAEGRRIGKAAGGSIATVRGRGFAGVADEAVMRTIRRAPHAADRHQLVHDLGETRRVLGDVDAWDGGLDGFVGPRISSGASIFKSYMS